MDDELWNTDRQTEQLRSVRADGRTVWSDSAAREVTARWLDPHDDLAGQVVTASRAQSEALGRARREQAEAEAAAQVATARASDVVGALSLVDARAADCQEACARAGEATDRAGVAVAQAGEAVGQAEQILSRAR